MPQKNHAGWQFLGAGLAIRFSRTAREFIFVVGLIRSFPLLFATGVTLSESNTTRDGQDIIVSTNTSGNAAGGVALGKRGTSSSDRRESIRPSTKPLPEK